MEIPLMRIMMIANWCQTTLVWHGGHYNVKVFKIWFSHAKQSWKSCLTLISPEEFPGVLVNSHGPFAWGTSGTKAVENAFAMEFVAEMAFYSKSIKPELTSVDDYLLNKHFKRKHGKGAYYGQKR